MVIDNVDLFKDNLAKLLASELPYVVTIHKATGYSKYYEWLEDTLGPKWVFAQRCGTWNIITKADTWANTYHYVVYFKYPEDATLFALRWP